MWEKFKWDMFVTSFIPLWISIVVVDIWSIITLAMEKWNNKIAIADNLITILGISQIQLTSIIVISIVVICSIGGINSFLKKLSNSTDRPKGKVVKAIKANKLSSEFLLAYILPMIAFNLWRYTKYYLVFDLLCCVSVSVH